MEANGEWPIAKDTIAYAPFRYSPCRTSLLGSAVADRLRLALVLHLIDGFEHLLMKLAVGALYHLVEIFVHDDVAGLRIDHDRALRAVELPAEQRLHGVVA